MEGWALVELGTRNRAVIERGYVLIYCPDHPFAKPNGSVNDKLRPHETTQPSDYCGVESPAG